MTPAERIATALERIADHFCSESAPATLPMLLDVKQAAKTLGLSPDFLYRLVRADKIPHVRAGRAIKFRASDLAKYEGTKKTRIDLRSLR